MNFFFLWLPEVIRNFSKCIFLEEHFFTLREDRHLAKTLSPMSVTGIPYSRAEMAVHFPEIVTVQWPLYRTLGQRWQSTSQKYLQYNDHHTLRQGRDGSPLPWNSYSTMTIIPYARAEIAVHSPEICTVQWPSYPTPGRRWQSTPLTSIYSTETIIPYSRAEIAVHFPEIFTVQRPSYRHLGRRWQYTSLKSFYCTVTIIPFCRSEVAVHIP